MIIHRERVLRRLDTQSLYKLVESLHFREFQNIIYKKYWSIFSSNINGEYEPSINDFNLSLWTSQMLSYFFKVYLYEIIVNIKLK